MVGPHGKACSVVISKNRLGGRNNMKKQTPKKARTVVSIKEYEELRNQYEFLAEEKVSLSNGKEKLQIALIESERFDSRRQLPNSTNVSPADVLKLIRSLTPSDRIDVLCKAALATSAEMQREIDIAKRTAGTVARDLEMLQLNMKNIGDGKVFP